MLQALVISIATGSCHHDKKIRERMMWTCGWGLSWWQREISTAPILFCFCLIYHMVYYKPPTKTLMLEKMRAGEGDNTGWDVGGHHRLNGYESEQVPGDSEGQGSLACCNPWSRKESDISYWLNNNMLRRKMNPQNVWTLTRFLSIKI